MNKNTEQLLSQLNTMQNQQIKLLNERIEVLKHTIEIDKITIKNLTETEKEILLELVTQAIKDIGLGEIEYLKPLQTIKNKLNE